MGKGAVERRSDALRFSFFPLSAAVALSFNNHSFNEDYSEGWPLCFFAQNYLALSG
jgi:hypothetical protein